MYWDQQSRWVQLRTGFVYLWKRDHRETWAYQSEAMFHRRTCVKVFPLSLLLSGVGHCYSVFLYAVSDCESKAHWIVQVLSTIFSSHRGLHCIARIKITNVDWVYLLPHTPKKLVPVAVAVCIASYVFFDISDVFTRVVLHHLTSSSNTNQPSMHLYEITHVFSQPPTINAVFHVFHMYTTMNISNGNKVFLRNIQRRWCRSCHWIIFILQQLT